jgi:hypothetical protein
MKVEPGQPVTLDDEGSWISLGISLSIEGARRVWEWTGTATDPSARSLVGIVICVIEDLRYVSSCDSSPTNTIVYLLFPATIGWLNASRLVST